MGTLRFNTHGGLRRGAGRKPTLSRRQLISVGAECENLWRGEAEWRAINRRELEERTRAIRSEQGRTALIPMRLRKTAGGKRAVREIGEEIDTVLDGRSRVVPITIKRPWGMRGDVIKRVRQWCFAQYGKKVTTRRVEAAWNAYRAFAKKAAT